MTSRAKRIAELIEKYIDPPTTKIEDWQWRPLSDVYRDTGYIEEVPAYIQDNFGQFMLDQTDRARRGEMGPRDMLKGYGIVSSSIMRGARDFESLVKSGLKIYDADPGEIRPEGAFANWLMSPLGQRYLDLGSTGVADLEAIEDIRRGFRPFGRQNELADSLKYAAEELAPRGAELNDLVLGSADDWRRFTEGVNGVSAGKSGFLASMFGRGDIPTFDTRQVVLHTGLPSKLISKYMSRSIGGRPIGGYEAVDRQAARQAALELGLDPALLDKYQHLAHHAIWDRIGNEMTTHKDLIRTLRPGMAKGGLVALAEKVFKAAQEAPRETVTAYKLFRTNPRHPEHLFPLFVDADRPVPMGEWLRAEAGPAGKTEGRVKSKLGDLAYRPGWHAGDLPIATHIGGGGSPPTYRPDNQVWAEIEMPADVDWQSIADSRARMTKAGLPDLKTAHITDQVPYGGYYRYKTNPNMTGNWLIGGDMRVNRVLTDDEVRAINDAHGVADLPRFKAEDIGEPEYAKGGLVSLMERALTQKEKIQNRIKKLEDDGYKTKFVESTRSRSKYLEIYDPEGLTSVKIRMSNHPVSGRGWEHSIPDIEIGNFEGKIGESAKNLPAAIKMAKEMLADKIKQWDEYLAIENSAPEGGLVALKEQALRLAQERAALPVEQHGLGLHPLNTPAERAEAMGFTVPAYHGSSSPDIERFRLNTDDEAGVLARYRQAVAENKPYGYMNFRDGSFFSPRPDYAEHYAVGDRATMYPVLLKADNPARTGSGFEPLKLRRTPDSMEVYNDGSLDEIAVIDPDNIRSRFAVFDPWRMNSGIAAALGLAAPDLLADENER